MPCSGLSYDDALRDKNQSLPSIAEMRVARHPGGSAATRRSSAVAAANRSVSMRQRSGEYSMLFDESWAG